MSEIGEISQHEIAPQKTKPAQGEITHAETVQHWNDDGDNSSARLINRNSKKDRAFWTEVGSASNNRNKNEKTFGLHPFWNNGKVSDTFFCIEEIPIKSNTKKEEPLSYSEEEERNAWIVDPPDKALGKDLFDSMVKDSGEESFVAMHLEGNILSIANKGNFQAVLGREGYAEPLTEYISLEEEAKVTEHNLPQGESQLVLGSAGLWDFLSPEEATKLIAQIKNPEEASRLLREEAYKRAQLKNGTVEDISVMVVNLDVPEKRVNFLDNLRQRKAARRYGREFAKAA